MGVCVCVCVCGSKERWCRRGMYTHMYVHTHLSVIEVDYRECVLLESVLLESVLLGGVLLQCVLLQCVLSPECY